MNLSPFADSADGDLPVPALRADIHPACGHECAALRAAAAHDLEEFALHHIPAGAAAS